MNESPWLTPEQAAAYVGCRTIKAFNTWTERRGVPPDGKRGRLRLFTKATLDRVLRNDARTVLRRVS